MTVVDLLIFKVAESVVGEKVVSVPTPWDVSFLRAELLFGLYLEKMTRVGIQLPKLALQWVETKDRF